MAAYHTGGSIYLDGEAITYAEAEAMRFFQFLRWLAAMRADDIEAIRVAAPRCQQLGAALGGCARWRRAAGWADPRELDAVRARVRDTIAIGETA